MKTSDILLSLEGKHLEVWRSVGHKICVMYADSEVKDGVFLATIFGSGDTFEDACDSYLRQIRGKTLVFNSFSDIREEIKILG